jgi:hypothetical protein
MERGYQLEPTLVPLALANHPKLITGGDHSKHCQRDTPQVIIHSAQTPSLYGQNELEWFSLRFSKVAGSSLLFTPSLYALSYPGL